MSKNTSLAARREELPEGPDQRGLLDELLIERNKLIEDNVALVAGIARRHLGRGLDYDDLFQEGILGLTTAAEKFDPSRGFRFSTYAMWWIRQAVQSSVIEHGGAVRKPSNYLSNIKKLLMASQHLEEELGRKPSVREIGRQIQMDPRLVRQILALIPEVLSLDAPMGDYDDSPFMDNLSGAVAVDPFEILLEKEMRSDIKRAIDSLDEKEAPTLLLRFGLSDGRRRSLREVGAIFNLSAERIRQFEIRALNKLRLTENGKRLRAYLGA